jgi:hypothetical protein
MGSLNGRQHHLHFFHPKDPVGVPEPINGVFKETIGRSLVPGLYNVQVIQNLFFIEFQGTAFKVEGNVRQAAGIVGERTLALTGQLNRSS